LFLLAGSAITIGLIHSLAPGHWLPVVLLARTKRWGLASSLLGALVAASGHILVSVGLGALALVLGAQVFTSHEASIERFSGLGLVAFGLSYAAWSWRRHRACHGHEHHGPEVTKQREKAPFAFLFFLGFSPCVAVLPVFVAAAPLGFLAVAATMGAFALGVLFALGGATLLVARGIMKLDHPLFEHHGDVLTGLAVALMGALLFFI
jgi:hypothetical protein